MPSDDIPIDFQWISIPASEFLMGAGDEQHVVNLPAYRIARCPVTNAQYKQYVDSTGCELPEHWEDGRIPKGKEQHPVVFVSWRDAMAFSEWADVSLPTEAQWEKAARGVDGRTYPWGETEPTTDLCSFSSNDTTPVGAFSPQGDSPYGLVDVAGNVWEWTTSLWGGDPFDAQFVYPYDATDGREDLTASNSVFRVLRGGAFNHFQSKMLHCTRRRGWLPQPRNQYVGFRVVCYEA